MKSDRITPLPPTTTQGKSWTEHDVLLYTSMPNRLREAIIRYVDNGMPTGSFLEAVLRNNLFKACKSADSESQEKLFQITYFILHVVPVVCRGSKNEFNTWIMASDHSRERQLFGARNWNIFKEWYDEQE